MHRRLADEAHPIGPAPATESYLNIERLLEAIEASGAEAVHPGYGFLAESAPFARAVESSGGVGRAAAGGDGSHGVQGHGRRSWPGRLASQPSLATMGRTSTRSVSPRKPETIGFPVLVKASAGGGGRGMRAVTRPQDFAEAVRGARREAEAAFGDGSVFLEKLIEDPRHVEVQVIGDAEGNVIHLYERECSIQRRHQKVVEEAPLQP